MPARMLSTPRRVCKNAVIKPEQTPISMADSSARNGWPIRATCAQTAHPRVKQPSVDRSHRLRVVKLM